jgi:Fe-S-cluster containining protein
MEAMDNVLKPIERGGAFYFECSSKVACFNQCCRDLVQALTPYDVLRLRRGLGLSSGRFLAQFTRKHTGPDSGLPVVTLRPADDRTRACPFVTSGGCQVYSDRPASCRMYPLVRALRRSRRTGRIEESFFILREPHCQGFLEIFRQTPTQWILDQELCDYNAENDRLLEIISLKNRLHPGPLSPQAMEQFTTALYDLDLFREQLANGRLPDAAELLPVFPGALSGDDLAMLHLAVEWFKRFLEKASAR